MKKENVANEESSDEELAHPERQPGDYPTGWRLHGITFCLLLMMFLAQMESTITSTSIITITDDLGGYLKSSWVLTAYWLTAGAFQIIWAKISDICGRKVSIIAAIFIFTAFSGACGGSQSVMQLTQFRWVQGIGGCGILALGSLVFFELVPEEKYPSYIALVGGVVTASLVIGPLIGGGVTVHGNWRWVFLFNVPVGVIAILALIWIFPRQLSLEPAKKLPPLSLKSLRRVDFLGCTLLLGTCLLLTTSLQQAIVYSFASAFVLPLLVCSVPFVIAFLVWSWFVTTRRTLPEPVFPWRFCRNRIRLGIVILSWTNGAILSTCVVQIPQRFMTVNGMSPLEASARFLAFGAFVPVGSTLAIMLISRLRLRPMVVAAFAVLLQVLGTVLLSRASTNFHVDASQYGFQIMIGTGTGLIISAVMTLIPITMEEQDIAVATAAQSQFRILGGLIAVSIGATIVTRYLKSHLSDILPPEMVGMLLQRTETMLLLAPDQLLQARELFGKAYNTQMYVGIGLSAAQVPILGMMWTNAMPVTKPKAG